MYIADNGGGILASIFGGLLMGAGIGIVYVREGTTGGTDIVNKIINRFRPEIKLGQISFLVNAAVAVSGYIVYKNLDVVMYAIIAVFVQAKVIDVLVYGGLEGKFLMIFSEKPHEISEKLLKQKRGVTLLHGEGAYSGEEKLVVCIAVHKNEYVKVKRIVKEIDPDAFVIITGANASGKSTFMKNMAVNAILAQALNTSLSKRYRGVVCRIMTSMALRDNLARGESYFVVEVKSLKRILEASREKTPLLCVIDEVLRGTNTTERIAASESVLAALRRANVLCLAATHDTELTYLLEDLYTNYHFEEQITAQSISFPYRLEQGPARGKNAIALLGNMGIDEKIVKQAERRAAEFETTGSWEKNKFLR